MEGSGLTLFALIFMLLSMGSVTALMAYCYWRILSHPESAPGSRSAGPDGGESL